MVAPPLSLASAESVSGSHFQFGCQRWWLGNPFEESNGSWCHGRCGAISDLEFYRLPKQKKIFFYYRKWIEQDLTSNWMSSSISASSWSGQQWLQSLTLISPTTSMILGCGGNLWESEGNLHRLEQNSTYELHQAQDQSGYATYNYHFMVWLVNNKTEQSR